MLFFYIFIRAAHVDIYAIKTKFFNKLRSFIKIFRFAPKNLREYWMFVF